MYSRLDNLYRHQKICKSIIPNEVKLIEQSKQIEQLQQRVNLLANPALISQTINITTQNTLNQIAVNQANTIVTINDTSKKPSGWPAKWPVPSIIPRPFLPPSFEITPEMLEQAIVNVGDIDGCRRGDIECVAKLGLECFKILHANPAERNIYLNPNRADQSLVYTQPSRWATMSLHDALNTGFDHLIKEITEVSQVMTPRTQDATLAAKKTFQTNSQRVIKSAQPSAVAHLSDLRTQLIEPTIDSWLGECIPFKISDLRWFCRETKQHLSMMSVNLSFETMLGVYSTANITSEAIPNLARRLPAIYARLVLTHHPENLTVIINKHDGRVFIHQPTGWEPICAIKAANMQIRSFATQVIRYITICESAILMPVAIYLKEHIDEVVELESSNLELLYRYAAEAERYYTATTGCTLEEPCRLLGINWPATAWTDKEIDDLIANWIMP